MLNAYERSSPASNVFIRNGQRAHRMVQVAVKFHLDNMYAQLYLTYEQRGGSMRLKSVFVPRYLIYLEKTRTRGHSTRRQTICRYTVDWSKQKITWEDFLSICLPPYVYGSGMQIDCVPRSTKCNSLRNHRTESEKIRASEHSSE